MSSVRKRSRSPRKAQDGDHANWVAPNFVDPSTSSSSLPLQWDGTQTMQNATMPWSGSLMGAPFATQAGSGFTPPMQAFPPMQGFPMQGFPQLQGMSQIPQTQGFSQMPGFPHMQGFPMQGFPHMQGIPQMQSFPQTGLPHMHGFPQMQNFPQMQSFPQMQLRDEQGELELFVANSITGKIIGRGGSNLDRIRRTSGAQVVVEKTVLPGDFRRIVLTGCRSSLGSAHALFDQSVQDAQAGLRPGALQQILTPCLPGMTTKEIHVDNTKSLGVLFGPNGGTINSIREQSNVAVEIVQHRGVPGAHASIHIGPGLPGQVESASAMVSAKLSKSDTPEVAAANEEIGATENGMRQAT